MTCDDPLLKAIADLNAAGYLVTNLFQVEPGMWRCVIRSEKDWLYAGWGIGKTPDEAVRKALQSQQPIAVTDADILELMEAIRDA